uniref:Uncharacterized protein n=1 Tax=uncultured prokaryote TaxID=198431 RepID=A0A0H5Q5B1_9ZZZZ|nr:hypothetical protein [uncultured prokaryote]
MPLPVPTDVVRVRLRATLREGATPTEEAQFGFWGQLAQSGGTGFSWGDVVQLWAEGIRDRWNEHVAYKAGWTDGVAMDSVKVDHLRDTDGSILDQGVATFTGDDAWVGTSSVSLPWETALAVSLFGYDRGVFATDKGRKRGRFYLPPMATGVLEDRGGEISTTVLPYINDQMGAFLNDVQGMSIGDVTDAHFNLGIVSRGTPQKPLTPTFYPVTNIYVDSKIDSQRRRERQQDPRQTLTTAIDRS